ncbi:hypothetical protein EON80_31865 [bacterium]|nr:MAG: hypothetical protein EON80_31865 [bacterium]
MTWYFWSQGITAHFSQEHDYRLDSLELDGPELAASGQPLIGVPEAQLLQALSGPQWGKVVVRDEIGRWLDVDDWGLMIWIDEGEVESVTISPLTDDNGDYIWPDLEGAKS